MPELEEQPVEQTTVATEEAPPEVPAPDVDPQGELLEQEPGEPEAPAPQPTSPEVLALIERQQQIIEQLQRGNQPPQAEPTPLVERLKKRGMDEGTAKLFSEFMAEALPELKGQFLERDYGALLHDVAQNTYQSKALDEVRRNMGATDAELAALKPHLDAVGKEYGNLPLKAAHELALVRLRGSKTATGLTAARQNKQDGLKKMTPPIKGGSAKLVPDKLSDDDYEKLSPLQRAAYLNGLDPAKYADL